MVDEVLLLVVLVVLGFELVELLVDDDVDAQDDTVEQALDT